MDVLVFWSCLALLLQFYGALCDQVDDRESLSDERIRRNHESDCEKFRVRNAQIKTTKSIPIKQKPKITPNPVTKEKLPINERNEPKDVRDINRILEEIAEVAHNHNETKGFHKIRHLVDEIDNQDIKTKHFEPNPVKSDKVTNISNKEGSVKEADKIGVKHQQANETKSKDSIKQLPHKSEKTLEIVKMVESKSSAKSKENINKQTLACERSSNNENNYHVEEKSSQNDGLKKHDGKNDNLIEIEEHTYEEENLHTKPRKYTQTNTYGNWFVGQNYNPGFPIYDYGNNNNIDNYYTNSVTYPAITYGECNNGNNDYKYVNFNANMPMWSQVSPCQRNEDYTRSRKTWLDRNTIVEVKEPDEYEVKSLNEEKEELTSIQRPGLCRNYYSITQKEYSRNNDVSENQYYLDPYHCS